MKKNIRVLGLIAAAAAAALSFTSCGKKVDETAWITDFTEAKQIAKKEGKNIFLLFSAVDSDETSKNLKETVFADKAFLDAVTPQYVLANLDFSSARYDAAQPSADASKKQKKAAEAADKKLKSDSDLATLYNVQGVPSVYLVNEDGYVISTIAQSDTVTTGAQYAQLVADDKEKVTAFAKLTDAVKNSKKIDRVNAIDALYEGSKPEYRYLMKDLLRTVPELDKKNTTGLVGKYELAIAYSDAMEEFSQQKIDEASKAFVDAINKGHMSKEQQQEAYYTAGYILAMGQSDKYDTIIDYLQKSYDLDPNNENAPMILNNIEQVKQMKASYEASKAAAPAEGPATADGKNATVGEAAPAAAPAAGKTK